MSDPTTPSKAGWLYRSIEQAKRYANDTKEWPSQVGGGWKDADSQERPKDKSEERS